MAQDEIDPNYDPSKDPKVSSSELVNELQSGPLYAAYHIPGVPEGHEILVTGTFTLAGTTYVMTNDPWHGVQRVQTYDEFQTYKTESGTNYYLSVVYAPSK